LQASGRRFYKGAGLFFARFHLSIAAIRSILHKRGTGSHGADGKKPHVPE
jgi:hypothetical protein